jgi:hypothetical protein
MKPPKTRRVFHEQRRELGQEQGYKREVRLSVEAHVVTLDTPIERERFHLVLLTWEGLLVDHAPPEPRRHHIRGTRVLEIVSPDDAPRIAVLAADQWFAHGTEKLRELVKAEAALAGGKVLS